LIRGFELDKVFLQGNGPCAVFITPVPQSVFGSPTTHARAHAANTKKPEWAQWRGGRLAAGVFLVRLVVLAPWNAVAEAVLRIVVSPSAVGAE
jgi:hypothetical protein